MVVVVGTRVVLLLALYSNALSAVSTFVATRFASIWHRIERLAYVAYEVRPKKMSKGLNGSRVYFANMFDLLSYVGCQLNPFGPEQRRYI